MHLVPKLLDRQDTCLCRTLRLASTNSSFRPVDHNDLAIAGVVLQLRHDVHRGSLRRRWKSWRLQGRGPGLAMRPWWRPFRGCGSQRRQSLRRRWKSWRPRNGRRDRSRRRRTWRTRPGSNWFRQRMRAGARYRNRHRCSRHLRRPRERLRPEPHARPRLSLPQSRRACRRTEVLASQRCPGTHP